MGSLVSKSTTSISNNSNKKYCKKNIYITLWGARILPFSEKLMPFLNSSNIGSGSLCGKITLSDFTLYTLSSITPMSSHHTLDASSPTHSSSRKFFSQAFSYVLIKVLFENLNGNKTSLPFLTPIEHPAFPILLLWRMSISLVTPSMDTSNFRSTPELVCPYWMLNI